jgi:glycosidase
MNNGKFDGGQLSENEKQLREFYKKLLNFAAGSSALMGEFEEIQTKNRKQKVGYDAGIYAFVRWSEKQKLVIITNFSTAKSSSFELIIPATLIKKWDLKEGNYLLKDQLDTKNNTVLKVVNGEGKAKIEIAPSASFIYQL